ARAQAPAVAAAKKELDARERGRIEALEALAPAREAIAVAAELLEGAKDRPQDFDLDPDSIWDLENELFTAKGMVSHPEPKDSVKALKIAQQARRTIESSHEAALEKRKL